MDLVQYRASESEQARTAAILEMLPGEGSSVLDIGARDGHFSRLLAQRYANVVALDLSRPAFDHPGVTCVQGDVCRLDWPDEAFDLVFCTEVLEHVPQLEQACREIARVARRHVLVGVPYRQDLRLARSSCHRCGEKNPPWGHVNAFDEERFGRLFPGLRMSTTRLIGEPRWNTNALSSLLMDLGGNPWGTYGQDETCIHCGASLVAPGEPRPAWQRACTAAADALNRAQRRLTRPHANWIHVLFRKEP